MELHQRSLLEKRSFFLLPNKLKIYLQDTTGETESYICYESLKNEAQVCRRKHPQLLFLTIAMLSFTVCILLQSLLTKQGLYYSVFPLAVAVLSIVLYQYKQQSYIIVKTYDFQRIIFLKDKPNRQALEKFLACLWAYRKQYLREQYFYINHDRDLQQQTERLRWLLEQNIITKAEYRLAQEDWIIDKSYQSH